MTTAVQIEPTGPAPRVATSTRRARRILPGFGLSLGVTLLMLTTIVLVPIASLVLKTATLSWSQFFGTITERTVLHALKVSFLAALAAAVVNGLAGLLVAWVLVRYRFPGRRLMDALVDFPFALPTAVAGLTFSDLYSDLGWLGRHSLFGLQLNFSNTAVGIVIVLVFVGLPFVVRTVQPILIDLEKDLEEASATLGAGRWYTFRRVLFPALAPAWLAGVALAFARAVGEYGSVIFIAGNIPGESEIAPLTIVKKLEQYEYAQATAIAVVLLVASLGVLLLIKALERWMRRHDTAP